jgi:hypothetical protein
VEVPLVEERELYLIGYGPVDAPHMTWSRSEPWLRLSAGTLADLTVTYGSATLWVKQVGTFDQSLPLRLAVPS